MKWSKLDKIETDCEKVNLPDVFKFKFVQSETSGK